MPKKPENKSKPSGTEFEVDNEVTDLREHARDRRSKMIGDQVVTILRDMLTSWRVPKSQK
jgi:hypothetical protein